MLSKQAWGPRHVVCRARLSDARPCPPSAAGDLVPSRAMPRGGPGCWARGVAQATELCSRTPSPVYLHQQEAHAPFRAGWA